MILPLDSPFFWLTVLPLLLLNMLYFFVFLPIGWRNKTALQYGKKPISIVICARNELENLRKNLHHVLNQANTEQDVVVVNDRSWDESYAYLQKLKSRYPMLHVVDVAESMHQTGGKKLGLMLGIKAAKSESILLTDADCRPMTPRWSQLYGHMYEKGYELIIGFSPIKSNGTFIGRLQRCDGFFTALQYVGWGLAGIPYMGVGRNMGYSKQKFFELGGFKKDYHIPAGDDDLFVNRNARKMKTGFMLHPDANVETEPKATFSEWLKQKKRHFSVSKYYRPRNKWIISMYPMALVLFAVGLTWWVCNLEGNTNLTAFYVVVGVKVFPATLAGWVAGRRLGLTGCGVFLIFFEYLFLVLHTLVYLLQKIRPIKSWT